MAQNSGRKRRGTPEERHTAAAKYQESVGRLQRIAYWNVRSTIAALCVFLGLVAVVSLSRGQSDGARLLPSLANVVGGVCGVGVYLSRSRPRLNLWLLLTAVAFTALGLAGLAIVAGNSS
ncbi:uncharacterized membrane protein YhaH (DUF805 family) [Actinoplanes campanulatus]|uniref:Uncharacterized membrane protein YhaH (DUF805 family) n=1 Tax=Actinoplanes campanulatus TaxID=113559 RepID=A0A7W5AE93_9ACTN|nr:hypothetical protein [Actinoplanes campanulatus]MBB3094384.1 uncharacterized membrane protein YhaH (DUF805 family) [Actinoplanes campanulatus]GGN20683.1 hypothetical protein GCM10010109_34490 [Actinoplanes campanulatus]GID35701.1 hypothetical protein Aca09nite_22070 [Actinoplanes campanulatus]